MEAFFVGLLKTSAVCAGIILLIALVSPFLKKGHTVFWRYLLWIILAVRLILPFDISVPELAVSLPLMTSVRQESVGIQKKDAQTENAGDHKIETVDNNYSHMEKAYRGVVYKDVQTGMVPVPVEKEMGKEMKEEMLLKMLICLWAVIAAFLFLAQVGSYWSFCMKLKKTKTYLFQKEKIPVFSSPLVKSPMLAGIWKPQIILPEQDYTQEQLAFILNHEYTHYKRKDLWVKLLLAGARTLHWFNPLVYYMERRGGMDIELLCDSRVVRDFSREEKKQYGEMLLACASGYGKGKNLLCVSRFSEKTQTLKERFSNIFSGAGRKKGMIFALLGAMVVLSASLFLALEFQENQSSSAQTDQDASNVKKDIKQQNVSVDADPTDKQEPDDTKESKPEIKMPELSVKDAANMPYGAVFPQLLYISTKRAVIYDYWGMMIYDVEKETIEQILDLPALDLARIQGETVTHIEVSEDGNQILFYNRPKTKERYLYHIDEKRLEYTELEHLENVYDKVVWEDDQEPYIVLYDTKPVDTLLLTKGENIHPVLNTEKIAYLKQDSLFLKKGKEFHHQDMMGLSLVIKNPSLGEAKTYPLFKKYYDKEYYEKQGKFVFSHEGYRDVKREVVSEEYLYEDEEGWRYYLEKDKEKESRIHKFAHLDTLLLVRRKDGKRQVLDDLITQNMASWCPVIFVDGRIVYKAASKAKSTGVKDPVLVSIALDGSDRKTADDILYHDVDNLCEDQGWIYYAGWTNDNAFPQPLCRIRADFSTGPQFVEDIPGLLVGVEDGVVYYLADKTKDSGIYKRNLKTGKEELYDNWGVAANDLSFFNSRKIKLITDDQEIVSASHLIFSYENQDELYTMNFRTSHIKSGNKTLINLD